MAQKEEHPRLISDLHTDPYMHISTGTHTCMGGDLENLKVKYMYLVLLSLFQNFFIELCSLVQPRHLSARIAATHRQPSIINSLLKQN